ncbi:MAG: HEAT repeat domain-containing protein [Luteibaculum sp.]
MSYWLEYYYFASHYPTRIAAWMGTILLLISVALIFFIFISRKSSQARHTRVERLKDKYETLLTNILFEDTYSSYSKGYDRIVKSITGNGLDKLSRETLVHVLLNAKENMMGESDKILTTFYHELNLRRYAMREMRRGKWNDKAFVMQELGKMDVKEALPTIMRYTNHPNPVLRAEAQYAAIDLGGERGLGFLEDLKYPLSQWQQIRILEELEKIKTEEIPSFYHLLQSKNDSVVVFGLRLIAHFNQIEQADELSPILEHGNKEVLKELANTLRQLEYSDIVPQIRKKFNSYSSDVKVSMLRAIAELGNKEEQTDFLFDLLHEKEYRIALAAARALYILYQGNFVSEMLQRAGNRALFLKHVLDERKH